MMQCSIIVWLEILRHTAVTIIKDAVHDCCRFAPMVVAFLACVNPFDALAAEPPFELARIDDGIYVHFGQVALTTPENTGDIANLGVVVGRDAVAVIDTGGSEAVGKALLAAVRRVTG